MFVFLVLLQNWLTFLFPNCSCCLFVFFRNSCAMFITLFEHYKNNNIGHVDQQCFGGPLCIVIVVIFYF